MKPRLYFETTHSQLPRRTGKPGRDPARPAGRNTEVVGTAAERLRLFVSEFVDIEAGRGDAEMSTARATALQGLPRLAATEDVHELAAEILRTGLIPAKAEVDASHIAVAAVHRMDFLLTWNCTHIHNIAISRQIERICARAGWLCPAICTPFNLLET